MAPRGKSRTERVPFGVMRQKMTIDQSTKKRLAAEGKVPRWINDDDHGQRIMQAMQGGYEHIQADEVGGQPQEDRRIRKLVGSNKDGSPKYAYLMAIEEKFYKEDQAKKEAVNSKVDTAIRGGNPTGLGHHGVSAEQGKTYVKNIDYTP